MSGGGWTRREWCRSVSLATAGAALAGCADDAPLPRGYAMAVFDVRDTAAAVWTMGPAPMAATVELDDGRTFVIAAGAAGSASVVVDALEPGREYTYRVRFADRTQSSWGRFVTPPSPAVDGGRIDPPLRFAVSADIGPEGELYGIFDRLPRDLDFYVNLGDWPYVDKEPAATTIDELRAKHRQVRDPSLIKRFLASTGIHAIYDDHDVHDNWDAAYTARHPEYVAEALAVWDEFFPRTGGPRHKRWSWGRAAELFLLDARLYRSANVDADGPDKTMLGTEQKEQLIADVTASDATFKIVFSSVPLDHVDSEDSWESFAFERDEILDRLAGVTGLVFISADRHYFASQTPRTGVREFLVGPLAAGLGSIPDTQPPEVTVRIHARNFVVVDVVDGTLDLFCCDASGLPLYRETISLTPAGGT